MIPWLCIGEMVSRSRREKEGREGGGRKQMEKMIDREE